MQIQNYVIWALMARYKCWGWSIQFSILFMNDGISNNAFSYFTKTWQKNIWIIHTEKHRSGRRKRSFANLPIHSSKIIMISMFSICRNPILNTDMVRYKYLHVICDQRLFLMYRQTLLWFLRILKNGAVFNNVPLMPLHYGGGW